MSLLVLGNGQLGSALLTAAGSRGLRSSGTTRAELDVNDAAVFEALLESRRPAVVINSTASHVVPACEHDPETAFVINAAAVQRLAAACHARGIGFVTYSTDYVFDGAKGSPYVETDLPNPLQTYGVSKYAGELLCALFHPGALIVRSCGLYGGARGSRAKGGNFVLTILDRAASPGDIEVTCEQIVNPTYAVDLAQATLELLDLRPAGGLVHLAAAGHCSWADFAAAIVAMSGRPGRIVPVDHGGRSGTLRRPRFSALDTGRARAMGVVLPTWQDGLRRYLQSLGLSVVA